MKKILIAVASLLSLTACGPTATTNSGSAPTTPTSVGFNDPKALADDIVAVWNAGDYPAGMMALSSSCVASAPRTFDCITDLSDGSHTNKSFIVSADGKDWAAKASQ